MEVMKTMTERIGCLRMIRDKVLVPVGAGVVTGIPSIAGAIAGEKIGRALVPNEWPIFMFIGETVGFITSIVAATIYSIRCQA